MELNRAEPAVMSAEYGRLDMVKLSVKVFKCPTVGSACTNVDGEGRMVVGDPGAVGTSAPCSL